MGLIDRPDQGLQNSLKNECSAKFLTKLWAFEDRDLASEDREFVWRLYGARLYRKIQYKYFTGMLPPTAAEVMLGDGRLLL